MTIKQNGLACRSLTYAKRLFAAIAAAALLVCQSLHANQTNSQELPLVSIKSLSYVGGFRLPTTKFGSGDNASHSYSPGPIAYNPANHSLFTVSHSYEQGIGEFAIPTIVSSSNPADFNTATVLQNFRAFHQAGQAPTGIDNYFLITGMVLAHGKLLVNFINWYDASGQETDTTAVFQNPTDLAQSAILGPFQLNGAAHAAGWLTPIPLAWQTLLGGDFIAGHAHGSIVSRLSVGPPAHVLSVRDITDASSAAAIDTNPVLDFSLAAPLYDTQRYDLSTTSYNDIAYNSDGRNNLWTRISGASYGFIVPDTGTYMTLGWAGGFHSKLGYKIEQTNGNVCGGPCSYDPDDNYNHYWLWRVADLVKVKQGEMLASEVRPYAWGKLDTIGNTARIKGAAFDAQTNQLYLSLHKGDPIPTYARPPLILVYQLDPTVLATAEESCFVIPMKPLENAQTSSRRVMQFCL